MTADISILDLFLQASLLVKLVMLTLLGMSIASWAMIIKRSKVLSQASKMQSNLKTNSGQVQTFPNFTKK